MIEYIIIAILAGILIGIITGLIPGLHINLLIAIFSSLSISIFLKLDPLITSVFIISLSTTHIIVGFVPSIYLGVPNSDTALNVLPGHRMVKQGLGHQALILNLYGGILGLLIVILLSPIIFLLIPRLYQGISSYIGYILIIICILLIIHNKKNYGWAIIILTLSGILGIFALNGAYIKEPLLPLFSGLFGLSTLLISINSENKIPRQKLNKFHASKKSLLKYSLIGSIFSSVFAFLPTISPSQIVVFISSVFGKIKTKNYLVLIGTINTAAFIISIFALYLFLKARNATVFFIYQGLDLYPTFIVFTLLVTCVIISLAISSIITIKISKSFAKIISKINYKKITLTIIIFILALVIVISGIIGVIVLLAASALGILCQQKDISKNILMASLIFPTIIYYLG